MEQLGYESKVAYVRMVLLENRRVQVQGRKKFLKQGVPQRGGLLSPILFLVFVNDISTCTTNIVAMYAEDLAIYSRESCIKVAKDRMQNTLYLEKWTKSLRTIIKEKEINDTIFI
jgi:hypothetical protein